MKLICILLFVVVSKALNPEDMIAKAEVNAEADPSDTVMEDEEST